MHVTCMFYATAVDYVTVSTGVGMGMLGNTMCSHAYNMQTYEVRNTCVHTLS